MSVSTVWPGYPLQCQIFTPATCFSSWGGVRSHRGLNQVSKGVCDDHHVVGGKTLLLSQSSVPCCLPADVASGHQSAALAQIL